ncbi:nineteen complex-related protein 2-domain-containing protein, partial [Blyttiomyces helicus]
MSNLFRKQKQKANAPLRRKPATPIDSDPDSDDNDTNDATASTDTIVFRRNRKDKEKKEKSASSKQTTPRSDQPDETVSVEVSDDHTPVPDTPRKTVAATKKPRLQKAVANTLSFEDEEEEEEVGKKVEGRMGEGRDGGASATSQFKIRKTAASRRMAKSKLARDLLPNSATPAAAPEASSAPSYSRESLEALRNSQLTRPSPQATPAPLQEVEADIPDASAIHAARKLREARRAAALSGEAPTGADFVKLDGKDEESKPARYAESSLVTEDQEADGPEVFEDYEGDRIVFGSRALREVEERHKTEMEGNIIEAQEEEIEDEEVQRWEMEQSRKGRARRDRKGKAGADAEPTPVRKPIRIPAISPLPTFNDAHARLVATLQNLEIDVSSRTSELAQTRRDLEASVAKSAELEGESKLSSQRYNYFQDLRTFIGDFAAFLDAKVPELQALQDQYHSVLRERANAVGARRVELADDCFAEFTTFQLPLDPTAPSTHAALSQAHAARIQRATASNARRRLRIDAAAMRDEPEPSLGMSTDDDMDADEDTAWDDIK